MAFGDSADDEEYPKDWLPENQASEEDKTHLPGIPLYDRVELGTTSHF